MPQIDLRLPTNLEVERTVLGSVLLYPHTLDTARPSLDTDDFSLDRNQRIWRQVCKIYDAGGKVDRITVYSALKDSGESEACGGLTYLTEIGEGVPEVPNIDSYAKILKDKTLRRRIITAAHHVMARAQVDDGPVDELLTAFGELETKLAKGNDDSKPVSTVDLIQEFGIDGVLSPRRHGEIRLPWKRLDSILSGFSGGQIIVLLGETARGKTSFALQAAQHVCGQGKCVLIWTMEMSPRSLFRRMVTQLSGVPLVGSSARLTLDERDRHRMAVARLTDTPIYFDRRSRSVSSFTASVRQVRSKSSLGLLVVDYLQLIRSNNRQNRAQQVSENSRNLKLAAMDLNLPILVLSQVDRSSVKGDGEIGLHSAKESGDVENDADVMLWIKLRKTKQLDRNKETELDLFVGKQREGVSGLAVPMVFRPESQTFVETDKEE